VDTRPSYPLRGRKPAAFALGVLGKSPNSENQNAQAFWFGIHAIFELWVLLRKTQEIVDAGIHAGRLSPWEFCKAKLRESAILSFKQMFLQPQKPVKLSLI
jgi:hypothetical protein